MGSVQLEHEKNVTKFIIVTLRNRVEEAEDIVKHEKGSSESERIKRGIVWGEISCTNL